ncbi:TPA: type 1 fimbrial protein [Serratia rubidaea]|nr:type 1 fimbrial protein [Serratia rubidaea]HDJ1447946.1 type 1 fimbrial protein [Serratia rubidaea]HDJ1461643.1 type 1 fimbrial protein [Serratia rubidaea]HDJ2774677.1 type 1 fimbrial protein [Serratia rubidaea]
MSVKNLCRWLVVIAAMAAGQAYAACTRYNTPTVQLDMVIGRVVVDPSAPVGSVLYEKSWTMSQSDINYYCTGRNDFSARIVATGVQDLGNKVYSTNVPGIGLRFRRGGAIQFTYPEVKNFDAGRGTRYYLAGSTFTLQVIKTAAVTGSGSVASGKYTSYDYVYGSNPILETYLSANALTIVSPSCTVMGGNNFSVDVGAIKTSDLNGVGTYAGGRRFPIQLQCNGGVSVSGYANVNMTFDGNLATGTTLSQGVLKNERTDSSAAQGVGIQVLDSRMNPLQFKKAYNVGRLANNQTQYIDLSYTARFYQYLSKITSGAVEAHMVFNLTYD